MNENTYDKHLKEVIKEAVDKKNDANMEAVKEEDQPLAAVVAEEVGFDFHKLTNTQEILDRYTEVIDEIQQNFFIKDELKAKTDFFDEGPTGSNLG